MITCALSDFPKHLGLSCGSKGIFPYKLNNPRFYGHKQFGLPHEHYFGVMNEKKRAEFEEFKRTLPSGYVFDFDKELEDYCRLVTAIVIIPSHTFTSHSQDVRVLLEGIVTFDKLLTTLCGWAPFSNVSFSWGKALHARTHVSAQSSCSV